MDEEERRNIIFSAVITMILELYFIQTVTCILELFHTENEPLHHERSQRVTIASYVPLTNTFTASQFQEDFRLTRTTFEKVESILDRYIHTHHITGRYQTSIRKQLLCTIWLLGTPESYRSVSERFGMEKGVMYKCVLRIVKILCKLSGKVIKWPNEFEQNRIKRNFLRYGLPGVIGAIDGTFIYCTAPKTDANAYNTRKCRHAIQLQGIAVTNLQFTDVFTGYPGSVGDYRVFRNSDIFKDIERNPEEFFPQEDHILGDKAYPLKTWCITPFKDNGRLTQEQRTFNHVHSSTRCVIERAFSLLKGRFRRLKNMEIIRNDLAPYYILASCVLHNICIHIGGEDVERYFDVDDDNTTTERSGDQSYENAAPQQASAAAIDKRNYLCSFVNRSE